MLYTKSLGVLAALRASSTLSFAPFGRSGCVTHAAMQTLALGVLVLLVIVVILLLIGVVVLVLQKKYPKI